MLSFKAYIFVAVVGLSAAQTPPQWRSHFSVSGTLQLPYAEISEPFAAHVDFTTRNSRIDYYGNDVLTYQLGGYGKDGILLKYTYMTTEQALNVRVCFNTTGIEFAPIEPQSILPDLTGFKKVDGERMNSVDCDKLVLVDIKGTKKNTYIMWLAKNTTTPVRYEMRGYDSLIGSHYDRYYLDYSDYSEEQPSADTFKPDPAIKCGGFPGPGVVGRIDANPMAEYINEDMRHHEVMFNQFKATHKRNYSTPQEHEQRKTNFKHNVRYIQSTNRAHKTYRVAVNHMADHSDKEIKLLSGYRNSKGYNGGLPFPAKDMVGDLPESWDWRLYGAVTPVKDQAVCGSCWSFGTTGTIEGQIFVKTGKRVRLSQQMLMDCSWGEGNNACDGGEDFRAYQWIMKHASLGGLASEEDYGAYRGADGQCRVGLVKGVVTLSGYVNVTAYDENALMTALANVGPVSVAIDASHKSLTFYADGVYYEPECGNMPADLDHAVLAVGYGMMKGEPYWLVKNSWSTYWGNDGYVLMSRKDNNCGVTTDATYPLL